MTPKQLSEALGFLGKYAEDRVVMCDMRGDTETSEIQIETLDSILVQMDEIADAHRAAIASALRGGRFPYESVSIDETGSENDE